MEWTGPYVSQRSTQKESPSFLNQQKNNKEGQRVWKVYKVDCKWVTNRGDIEKILIFENFQQGNPNWSYCEFILLCEEYGINWWQISSNSTEDPLVPKKPIIGRIETQKGNPRSGLLQRAHRTAQLKPNRTKRKRWWEKILRNFHS